MKPYSSNPRFPAPGLLTSLLLALLGTGCPDDGPADWSPAALPQPVAVPDAVGVTWTPCDPSLECGTVQVPASYADPDAGTLDVAISIRRATGASRLGYLLVNPGGPGVGGRFMAELAEFFFSRAVRERFDIVAFDPRGVETSTPRYDCGDIQVQLELLSRIEGRIDTEEEAALAEQVVGLCVTNTGAGVMELHTEAVARDMDEIRKALGAEQISYLGFSWGATLGTWYASLFPAAVRAMALDAAPYDGGRAATLEQRADRTLFELGEFEQALDDALRACSDASCPIHNDGDPHSFFADTVPLLERVSEAFGHPNAGLMAVAGVLYGEQYRELFWQGLSDLRATGATAALEQLAEINLSPGEPLISGTSHIYCLDDWNTFQGESRERRLALSRMVSERAGSMFPLISSVPAFEYDLCPYYDVHVGSAYEGTLDGSDVPILVVGNEFDPVTPLESSRALAEQALSNGYLVVVDHPNHGVYPNNPCVVEAVDTALLLNQLPRTRELICP